MWVGSPVFFFYDESEATWKTVLLDNRFWDYWNLKVKQLLDKIKQNIVIFIGSYLQNN